MQLTMTETDGTSALAPAAPEFPLEPCLVTVNGKEYQWNPETGLDTAAVIGLERLIYKHARRYEKAVRGHVLADDLAQSGYIAAMQACKTYNPLGGLSFFGWAQYRITHDMLNHLHREMKHARITYSLDEPTSEGTDETFVDLIPSDSDTHAEAEAAWEKQKNAKALKRLWALLSDQERQLVDFVIGHGKRVSEAAAEMGFTRQRGQQLIDSVFRKAKRLRWNLV